MQLSLFTASHRTHLGTPTPNWRLEAAITGTLGSVPPHLWRQASLPASQRGFQPRDPLAMARVSSCADFGSRIADFKSETPYVGSYGERAAISAEDSQPRYLGSYENGANKKAPDCSGAF